MDPLLGLRLKEIRVKKKIPQNQFAKGIISTSYLSNIESCRKMPAVETLELLAKRLEVPVAIFECQNSLAISEELGTILKRIMLSFRPSDEEVKALVALEKKKWLSVEQELMIRFLKRVVFYKYYDDTRYLMNDEVDDFILENPQIILSDEAKLYFYYYLGTQAINRKSADAMLYFEKMIQLTLENNHIELMIGVNFYMMLAFYKVGGYEQAFTRLDSQEMLIQTLPDTEEKKHYLVLLYYCKGVGFAKIGFYKKALVQFEKLEDDDLNPYAHPQYYFNSMARRLTICQMQKDEKAIVNAARKLDGRLHDFVDSNNIHQEKTDYAWLSRPNGILLNYYASVAQFEQLKKIWILEEKIAKNDFSDLSAYGKALYEYDQENYEAYEQHMLDYIAFAEPLRNEYALEPACRHLSDFYATQRLYKQSMFILNKIK